MKYFFRSIFILPTLLFVAIYGGVSMVIGYKIKFFRPYMLFVFSICKIDIDN